MSILTSLYETYLQAEDSGLVDLISNDPEVPTLLPIYHNSKKSSNGKDIIEILIDEDGKFINAKWLEKGQAIIFPITENSIKRAGRVIAPHALADEMSYSSQQLDSSKYDAFVKGLAEWVGYAKDNDPNKFLEAIYKYISTTDILSDVVSSIFGCKYYVNDKSEVELTDSSGEKMTANFSKVMLTFKVENRNPLEPNLSVTSNKSLHQNYVRFVEATNKDKDLNLCDVTGFEKYCTDKHPGLLGTPKLVSVSNNKETYFGRFRDGTEIVHIGYDTSQKIHLMVKYLLENKPNKRNLGDSSILLTWFSDDINNSEGLNIMSSISEIIAEDVVDDDNDDDDVYEVASSDQLGGEISSALNDYLTGKQVDINPNSMFFVLILDKSSNGRISIKYFRKLPKSDLYERVSKWYNHTSWTVSRKHGKYKRTPPLFMLIDAVYGQEGSEGKNRQNRLITRNKKLRASSLERLLPCIIDGKRFPKDMKKKMLNNLYKRNSYDDTWSTIVEISCSIFKKAESEEGKWKEGKEMLDINNENRSYLFGRLLALFEKAEHDAMSKRNDSNSNPDGSGSSSSQRSTNAQRLWTAFTQNPERTRMTLETKMRPYWDRLQKSSPGMYTYYQKMLQEITDKLAKNSMNDSNRNRPLDEQFIYGYYGQRQDFFTKKKVEA